MSPTSGPYVTSPRRRSRITAVAFLPLLALGVVLVGCLAQDGPLVPESEVRTIEAPRTPTDHDSVEPELTPEIPAPTATTVPAPDPAPEPIPDATAAEPATDAGPPPSADPLPAGNDVEPAPGLDATPTTVATPPSSPAAAVPAEAAVLAPATSGSVPSAPDASGAPSPSVPAPSPATSVAPAPVPAPAPEPTTPVEETPPPVVAPSPPVVEPPPPVVELPPPVVPAPTGSFPTPATTGPRVADPAHIPGFEVRGPMTLRDVVVDGHIRVLPGADLVLDHVEVRDGIIFLAEPGKPMTRLHADGVRGKEIYAATMNPDGTIYHLQYQGPSSEVPAELVVTNSYFNSPPATPPAHTETIAGFGWIKGARFVDTTIIQQGPNNGTQTATVNWHGADTVFERCYFGWAPTGQPAAWFTVYVSGPRNVVRDSVFENGGLEGRVGRYYVYPDPDKGGEPATYVGNVDAVTGAPAGR